MSRASCQLPLVWPTLPIFLGQLFKPQKVYVCSIHCCISSFANRKRYGYFFHLHCPYASSRLCSAESGLVQPRSEPQIPVSVLFCRAAGTGKQAEPAACSLPIACSLGGIKYLEIKYFIASEPAQNDLDLQSDSLCTV